MTTHQINDAGLAFIAEELNRRNKRFAMCRRVNVSREMLLAWAADAERSLEAGNGADFEIRDWDAVSGHTELVRLDVTEHFTTTQQEIEG